MKYEIIKGSEKDFEGAPEWATECVWNDKGNESFCYWLNPKTKTIFNPNWHVKPDCWNEEYGWRNYVKAERRPITEPVVNQQLTTEWSGEGLPPVGLEVECRINEGNIKCKVLGYDYGGAAVVLRDIETNKYFACQLCGIYPIRSAEDVARSNIIGEMERTYEDLTGKPAREAEEYYDFIAAGKITGITKTPTVSELMRVTEKATREDCEAIVKLLSGK